MKLADAKGSLKSTAEELDTTPQILTRWHWERLLSEGTKAGSSTQMGREQQKILRLKKEFKQAEFDWMAEATRYLKIGLASSPAMTETTARPFVYSYLTTYK